MIWIVVEIHKAVLIEEPYVFKTFDCRLIFPVRYADIEIPTWLEGVPDIPHNALEYLVAGNVL